MSCHNWLPNFSNGLDLYIRVNKNTTFLIKHAQKVNIQLNCCFLLKNTTPQFFKSLFNHFIPNNPLQVQDILEHYHQLACKVPWNIFLKNISKSNGNNISHILQTAPFDHIISRTHVSQICDKYQSLTPLLTPRDSTNPLDLLAIPGVQTTIIRETLHYMNNIIALDTKMNLNKAYTHWIQPTWKHPSWFYTL